MRLHNISTSHFNVFLKKCKTFWIMSSLMDLLALVWESAKGSWVRTPDLQI